VAYYELEPFGARRDNWHAGMIAALLANIHRGKGAKAASPADFMLEDPGARAKKRSQTTIARLMQLAQRDQDG